MHGLLDQQLSTTLTRLFGLKTYNMSIQKIKELTGDFDKDPFILIVDLDQISSNKDSENLG